MLTLAAFVSLYLYLCANVHELCSSVESWCDGFDVSLYYVNRASMGEQRQQQHERNLSNRMKMKWVKFDFRPKSIHETKANEFIENGEKPFNHPMPSPLL